jgi:hypothetical protein
MLNIPKYQPRPVRFLQLYQVDGWQVKIYSISVLSERVSQANLDLALQELSGWLKSAAIYELDTYKIATLILHEGKEGCFAIVSWWIDGNMLQLFVYLADRAAPGLFRRYSDQGIVTCVWEMEVLWFERNAWIECVLKHPENPHALDNYLATHLHSEA